MLYFQDKQYPARTCNFNAILKDITYDLDEMEGKLLLAQFLKHNLGYTVELMSGFRLSPLQEIILKELFLKDNALIVGGRGFGKSKLISVFTVFFPIFYPASKICLISANFRAARNVFNEGFKLVNNKSANLLAECFGGAEPSKRNDVVSWDFEGRQIYALPLSSGEGLRGHRASVALVDEGLLISKEIQTTIIKPFLSSRLNFQEETRIKTLEDKLIKEKVLKEEDRLSFPANKYLVFSSASYKFQYLYEIFDNYIHEIEASKGKDKNAPTYFVARVSYKALPANSYMDSRAIEAAKANGNENTESFKREWEALFSEGNNGYFNAKLLELCTVPDRMMPCTQIKGQPGSKYILAIDPSYSSSKASDFFSMQVFMLVPEKRELVLVHTFARAGVDILDAYKYLTYILNFFNIVYISIDGSGTEFIDSYNQSTITVENKINLKYIDCDFEKEDYLSEVNKAQQIYNLTNKTIVYAQSFTSEYKRRANEYLQDGIASKKILFASKICAMDDAYRDAAQMTLPYSFKDKDDQEMDIHMFLADQDTWINETKSQLGLIEVKPTALGTLTYDLPSTFKRDSNVNRVRRDLWTTTYMAYYSSKHYFDIMFSPPTNNSSTFEPLFF